MAERTLSPELKAAWDRFERRFPDLSRDRAAVEEAANAAIADAEKQGLTRAETLDRLVSDTAKRLGCVPMSDQLADRARKLWGEP